MKKRVLTSLFLLISATSSNLLAGNYNYSGGGFAGASAAPTTVAQVRDVSIFQDDVYVTLKGNIVESVGYEDYTFRDHTGTITLEIEHDKWWGQNVDINTTVVIHGELERGLFGRFIEVDSLRAI